MIKILILILSAPSMLTAVSPAIPEVGNTLFTRYAPAHSDTLPAPSRNPLAPGNVRIQAKIIKLDNSKRATILTMKIIRIDGYGSATPPLTPDRILKVDATEAARLAPDRIPLMERGGRLNAIIRHQPELKPDVTDPAWTLETFCLNEHTQKESKN